MFLVFGVPLLLDGLFPGSLAGPVAAASILTVAAIAGVVHWVRARGSDALPAGETKESLDR